MKGNIEMKAMNFPERKNQRRKDALDRLQAALAVPQDGKDNDQRVKNLKKAIENTEAKIVQGSRINDFTKVNRSGKR
jgi:hypothetical protein